MSAGIFEAGFFPGAIYLVNRWYGPRQLQTRIAGLYTASALSGAFSGLLAFAIAKMDGIGGKGGWAWIFSETSAYLKMLKVLTSVLVLEGIVTVFFGVLCFFALPDSPSLSKWITDDERKYMDVLAVIKNGGRSSEQTEKFKWSLLREIVLDFKIWLQAFVLFMLGMCTYGSFLRG